MRWKFTKEAWKNIWCVLKMENLPNQGDVRPGSVQYHGWGLEHECSSARAFERLTSSRPLARKRSSARASCARAPERSSALHSNAGTHERSSARALDHACARQTLARLSVQPPSWIHAGLASRWPNGLMAISISGTNILETAFSQFFSSSSKVDPKTFALRFVWRGWAVWFVLRELNKLFKIQLCLEHNYWNIL